MKWTCAITLLCICAGSFAQPAKETGSYKEPYRPQFHFTPASKWMNDPNGLVYLNGKYHLFYQYYPGDIVWGPMHWGHATSTDLLHWKHLPIALYPDSLGWIFSGSAVIDKQNTAGFGANAMVAIFTYHNDAIWKRGLKNTESQGIAYSLDEGKSWKKYKGNPVLNNTGEQDFRDPKVFWNQQVKKWNMVLAVGDRIRIFSSANLKEWSFESDFKPDNDEHGLGVWECPDLFKMKIKNSNAEKWVMIINHGDKTPNGGSGTRYFVGDFDGNTFTNTQQSSWLDAGPDFYAAVSFDNIPGEKRILLGWMSNWQYATKVPTTTWRSAMTMPRELELVKMNDQYYLNQKMIEQFSSITKSVISETVQNLPFEKKQLDLSQAELSFGMDENARDLVIEVSNTKGERLEISLNNGELQINRHRSGKTDFSENFASKPAVMPLGEEKIRNFQLIFDKSSVELLLNNGRYSMTNIFFPTEGYSILKIYSGSAKSITDVKLKSVNRVW